MRLHSAAVIGATAIAGIGAALPISSASTPSLAIWQRCSISRQRYYEGNGYVCARPNKHSHYRLYAEPPPSPTSDAITTR